jgi:hypothetical protein
MKCPRCQQENPPQAKFCLECGAPINRATPAPGSSAEAKAEIEGLRRSLSEALEQQTATSEILHVISSSPTDIQPVLDAVVKSASRLCESLDGVIFRLEGDRLRLTAHYGLMPANGQIGAAEIPLIPGMVNARAVVERRAIHVADLQAEDAEFPEGSALARRLGWKTTLCVPLMREGVPLAPTIRECTRRRTEGLQRVRG